MMAASHIILAPFPNADQNGTSGQFCKSILQRIWPNNTSD